MFNNLYDENEQNIDFNIQNQKSKASELNYRFKFGEENIFYHEKDYKTIEQYNRKKYIPNKMMKNTYGKGKTILKAVIYQNGFIVNNGEFKDISFPENKKFLEEIEKGNIPYELIKKGIFDVEILLENRKNEIYGSTYYNTYNNDIYETNAFQNSSKFQYQDPNIYSYSINDNFKENNEIILPSSKIANTFISHNNRKIMNDKPKSLYSSSTMRVENRQITQKNNKRKNSHKKESNFIDFLDFKKEADKKKKDNKENEEQKQKFIPFSGYGQLIRDINTQGLFVNKSANTSANIYCPICYINIRLFNGEIIKAPFNHWQTIGDVYVYVRKLSGSENFVLLDGFPPKPLTKYGSTISELGLQNSVLTQKIN